MHFMDDLEKQIIKLAKNNIGIEIEKNFVRGILSAEIKIPKSKIEKGITDSDLKFEIIIDSYGTTLFPIPKLYCLTPYCFPNLADGRDLFRELKNCGNYRRGDLILTNLIRELFEFIKTNYERGGLLFCGNYYLDTKYEKRFFENNKCKIITDVKHNLFIKGKNTIKNRILILSDVYFLFFKKDRSDKNKIILLFWSSFNNIEKIQKLSDNKTVILYWTTKDKYDSYAMNLSFENRNDFLKDFMERTKKFGMHFDIIKLNNQKEVGHENFTSDLKFKSLEKENEKENKKEKEKENDKKSNIKKLDEEKLDVDEGDKNKEKNKIDETLEDKIEDSSKNININEIFAKINK